MANAPQTTAETAKDTASKAADTTAKVADATAAKTAEAIDVGSAAFKKAFEQTTTAVSELSTQSKRNMEALAESATAAAEAAQTLGAQAVAYAKKSAEDQAATVRKLAGARSFQEAWEIQSNWAKSAFDAHLAEANRFSDAFAASTASAWRPINERVQAVAEQYTFVR